MCAAGGCRVGAGCVDIAREADQEALGAGEGMCDVGGFSELSGVEMLGWGVFRVDSAHEEGRALGVAMSGITKPTTWLR